MKYEYLKQFAETDAQKELLAALMDVDNISQAALLVGRDRSNCGKTLKALQLKAAQQGVAPDNDMNHQVPDGFQVKGVSTYYDKDGKPSAQWVKTNADKDRQYEMLQEGIKAFAEDLPQLEHRDFVGPTMRHLMAVYPIGDAHIGMYAPEDLAGEPWNLDIAERIQCGAMDRLVSMAPPTTKATIINLGDWFHFDNMAGVTSRNHHSLSTAGSYAEQAKVAVKVLRQCIESALTKHEQVHVINVIGNHDDVSSIMLNICIQHVYANEPRVTIDESSTAFNYFTHGSVLVGCHHGHSTKFDKLPAVMATDRAKDWGNAKHRYWYCGHVHHRSVKDYPGCTVETFRTLAAKDDYAINGGWRAPRDMNCIVLHEEHGEVSRITVNPQMVS